MANHGGKRPGAGRKPNSKNKATKELRELAQTYTEEAVEILIKIARNAESDAARVSACKEILDRGHGKSTQHVEASIKRDLTSLSDEELAILAGEEDTAQS